MTNVILFIQPSEGPSLSSSPVLPQELLLHVELIEFLLELVDLLAILLELQSSDLLKDLDVGLSIVSLDVEQGVNAELEEEAVNESIDGGIWTREEPNFLNRT